MKSKIETIYDNGYSMKQYFKDGWECFLDNDEEVPMTIVVEVTNMYGATGEEEYKDYNYVFSIGLLNKDIHPSIKDYMGPDYGDTPDEILGYFGLNCYLDEFFMSTDESNNKFLNELTINQACLSQYKCRFTGKMKNYLKFKTEEDAFAYAEKIVQAYGEIAMTLIGFHLDKPINLIGQTAWEQTKKLHLGE